MAWLRFINDLKTSGGNSSLKDGVMIEERSAWYSEAVANNVQACKCSDMFYLRFAKSPATAMPKIVATNPITQSLAHVLLKK